MCHESYTLRHATSLDLLYKTDVPRFVVKRQCGYLVPARTAKDTAVNELRVYVDGRPKSRCLGLGFATHESALDNDAQAIGWTANEMCLYGVGESFYLLLLYTCTRLVVRGNVY